MEWDDGYNTASHAAHVRMSREKKKKYIVSTTTLQVVVLFSD